VNSKTRKAAIITGGAGLLGVQHARSVAALGLLPVIFDIDSNGLAEATLKLDRDYGIEALGVVGSVTSEPDIHELAGRISDEGLDIHGLINNASRNPKMNSNGGDPNRLENLSTSAFIEGISVDLVGSFLCIKVFGPQMALKGSGSIVNISSDLGIISPDQRIYEIDGLRPEDQPVKPVSYSVAKAGLLGLTRYVATYWAKTGVRCNAVCLGGVDDNQPAHIRNRLKQRIPIGRMARPEEYIGLVRFLLSEESSYVTGAIISADGGRSAW